MAGNRKIDKVRASRDGHEFHEAWTARKAMQLLWPASDLTAIAVEGPSPSDQTGASAATLEVADITLYFGGQSTFEWAARTTFAQFKYSIQEATRSRQRVLESYESSCVKRRDMPAPTGI
jgi:hypothetical protein